MTQRARLLTILAQDVQDDLLDYRQLELLLPELHQALLARDNPLIARLNERIESFCAQVRVRAQRRSKALAALGLGAGAAAMSSLLQHFSAAPRQLLDSGWQALRAAAARCAEHNERNGQLLAMHHEIIEQLLGESTRNQLYAPPSHAY
ncbi:flagellar protein FlgN [Pseudomonas sp. L-22-4S-12]|uniref:flagellar export chaperone FlgN n=1 Tax=Pseudomonas sp. L-22-4S-12 TaxID=2610893 RepID=UPI00132208E0|nr:flagellar protein FlgN [Pseudomonas sp. L-22-4S-12]